MKVIGYLENQNFLGFTRDTKFQCRPNNKIYFQDSSILLLRVPLIGIIDQEAWSQLHVWIWVRI